jgi:hypothetical protein
MVRQPAAEEKAMDIRTKNTGRAFYQVPPDLASVLLELGLVERVEKPAPAPRSEEWGIGKTIGGHVCINLRLPSDEIRVYDGFPEDAANGFKYRQWDGGKQEYVIVGPVPPESILEAYKAQYVPRMR